MEAPADLERLNRRAFFKQTRDLALCVPVVWMTGCRATESGSEPRGMDALAGSLSGRFVPRGHRDYDDLRLLYNMQFDAASNPIGIARCGSAQDVARVLQWAQQNHVQVVARGGGHSYGGYSTTPGIVIDVRPMNSVSVADSGVATVGAGASLLDVYTGLAAHGRTIPAGSCPTVGVAGHALGGGYGLASRKFGTVSDNILDVEIVTAAGEVLVCNDRQNADLYWACRGGGGGNFGVVTRLTLRSHAVGTAAYFMVDWPWRDAAAVLDFWQGWAPSAPDELTSICRLTASSTGVAGVRVIGQYLGTQAQLAALLEPLLAGSVGTPAKQVIGSDSYLNVIRMWSGDGNTASSLTPLAGQARRENFRAKSDFIAQPLPTPAIATAIRWIEARGAIGRGAIMFDAFGGAIGRIDPDATAFVHRAPLFHAQYLGHQTAATASANRAWLNGFWNDMRPYVSGSSYQNYIDPDLADWETAYYGANYARLVRVKAKYDPDNVFRSAQSIRPA